MISLRGMMERPDHAPASAVPSGNFAPSPWAWMTSICEAEGNANVVCGVEQFWIDPEGGARQLKVNFEDPFGRLCTHLDMAVDLSAPSLASLAMQDEAAREWIELVAPLLLASDRVDAMTKLRLAARWAEAKA